MQIFKTSVSTVWSIFMLTGIASLICAVAIPSNQMGRKDMLSNKGSDSTKLGRVERVRAKWNINGLWDSQEELLSRSSSSKLASSSSRKRTKVPVPTKESLSTIPSSSPHRHHDEKRQQTKQQLSQGSKKPIEKHRQKYNVNNGKAAGSIKPSIIKIHSLPQTQKANSFKKGSGLGLGTKASLLLSPTTAKTITTPNKKRDKPKPSAFVEVTGRPNSKLTHTVSTSSTTSTSTTTLIISTTAPLSNSITSITSSSSGSSTTNKIPFVQVSAKIPHLQPIATTPITPSSTVSSSIAPSLTAPLSIPIASSSTAPFSIPIALSSTITQRRTTTPSPPTSSSTVVYYPKTSNTLLSILSASVTPAVSIPHTPFLFMEENSFLTRVAISLFYSSIAIAPVVFSLFPLSLTAFGLGLRKKRDLTQTARQMIPPNFIEYLAQIITEIESRQNGNAKVTR